MYNHRHLIAAMTALNARQARQWWLINAGYGLDFVAAFDNN